MEQSINTGYLFDFAICVDATASMGSFISSLKKFMPSFESVVKKELDELSFDSGPVRVKFVFFRDYGYDEQPMIESEFFTLPEDEEYMMAFLEHMEAVGGGDKPESALEAMVVARNSEWRNSFAARQVVALFTDADAHPLGLHSYIAGYPTDMPATADEFLELWNRPGECGFTPRRCRLMIVCPKESSVWDYFNDWMGFGFFHCENPAEMDEEYIKDMFRGAVGCI